MRYNKDQIGKILNIYSELCSRKKNRVDKTQNYERIPYDEWTLIKSAKYIDIVFLGTKNYITVEVTVMPADKELTYHSGGYDESNTFGDFLIKVIQGDYDDRIMPTENDVAVKYSYNDFCSKLDSAATSAAVIDNTAAEYYEYNPTYTITDYCAPSEGQLASNKTTFKTLYDYYNDKSICSVSSSFNNIEELSDRVKALENTINNKKEGKENMKGFNFEFGTCEKDNVRMSMYGLAVQNATGSWVSYNATSKSVIDVDILNVDCRKYMFKMPVAMKDIKVGDIVIHNKKPMFVVDKTNGLTVIDVVAGEEKKILLTKNMFGFDFATKVVSMFDMSGANATADSPFGNMLPLLLLGNEAKGDNDAMLMYMMMQGQSGFDPMMMMLLMGDNKSSNMLPLMFMMNQNKPAATPTAAPSTVTE